LGAGTNSSVTAYGLSTDHAYSILGTYTVTETVSGKTHNLYRIRNPWGYDDSGFSGAWKPGSSMWSLINSAAVDYSTLDDGVLYLEDYEFVQAYNNLFIGYEDSTYVNNYVEITDDDYATYYFEFTLASAAETFVGIHFYNDRFYPYSCKNDDNYGYFSLYTSTGTTIVAN
jgi:hypothetical protein